MKPAPFDYVAARSLDEALALLADFGGDAKLLAGGQSLIPVLNFRLAQPAKLIDLNRVPDLDFVRAQPDGSLRLGALVRHRRLERDPVIARHAPLVHETAPHIAHPQIRNRGTLGGSLAHADPAADWPLVMAAWGASVEIAGEQGIRRVAADVFMSGAYVTALGEGEMLAAVHLPRLSHQARWAYRKFCRKPGEFAEAAAAVLFDPGRHVARVFIGTPAGRPTSLPDLAADIARRGRAALSADAIAEACEPALAEVPLARRQACHVMLQRALEEVLS